MCLVSKAVTMASRSSSALSLRLLVLALCQKVRKVEKESLKQALTQLHIAKRKKERRRLRVSDCSCMS
jgi:hypothetical protein